MSNKWETAPSSIKDLYSAIKGIIDYGLLGFDVVDFFDRVLDDYNELEAKHQEACEMISQQKEEINNLRERLIDGVLEENIGNRVADSIRKACEKDVCKLSPYTRIDIHVNEFKDLPFIVDRYALPRIAIMFNNTQTEMERDTAEHECEELNEKIKELIKENKDLKQTLAMCERDANTARNLCDTIAFNADRARNKTPWFIIPNTFKEEK